MISSFKQHPLLKIVSGSLISLPSPSSLTSWWNLGSLLGLCLIIQLSTGVLLATSYSADTSLSFMTVIGACWDNETGWVLRMLHANGASFFFFCLYLHTGRGVYYGSFALQETWGVGVILFLLVMAAAFLGYVLPWGQMSFWGTAVITSLLSAIPHIGEDVAVWTWGGMGVGNSTLTRFFAFHFVVPFIVTALVGLHLLFLHQSGSSNPLGLSLNPLKVPFHPYFSFKDTVGAYALTVCLGGLILVDPWCLGDPENFIPANPLVTPVHIQPEWYFLFAYAILRSIPNKLGGVIALVMAILILLSLAATPSTAFRGSSFYPLSKLLFWGLVGTVLLLTWIGARPVEEPYVTCGQLLALMYFTFYLINAPLKYLWNSYFLTSSLI